MKGLLYLDYKSLFKSFRIYFLMILAYLVIALIANMGSFLGFALVFMAMIPYYLLQAEDAGRVSALLLTLPVSRKLIVRERYLTVLLFWGFTLLLLPVIYLRFGWTVCLASLLQCSVSELILAVILPLSYKFGQTKARLILLFTMALYFSSTGAIFGLIEGGFSLPPALPALLPLLSAAALAGSYLLSVRIFEQREL